MRKVLVVLIVLLVAACSAETTATTGEEATSTTATPIATSTLPPIVECPGVGDFEEGRGIADMPSEGSDSRTIGRISWETSDQCETFHFDFETSEGAPATTAPSVEVDHLESFQVVRISMDIDATMVSDQLVETNLVDRLYVVRSLSGGMFIDLHLAAPAAVRAATSSSPARLSLDLRPGFVPFSGRSTIGDHVVLTSPTSGSEVGPEVQLLGYARTSEGRVIAIATQREKVIAETSTTTADQVVTWGEYRIPMKLVPGDITVFVGESGSENQGPQGITIDLTAP